MDIEFLREYCLSKPATTESFPFDEVTLVFKVMNKMYALVGLERLPPAVNLKCDPERAIELREEYDGAIIPGFHMSKKHWNTVMLEDVDDKLIIELVDHSYDLVVSKMTKKDREALKEMQ
ncbi:MAG: MmcQ/YjbR family DNA-binding protein [Saprospiraceae bacterium]